MDKEKRYLPDAGIFLVQSKDKDTQVRFISKRSINQGDLQINILPKNSQPLPDISSPFLKKTVNNLFSHKKITKLSPIVRYNPNQKLFLSTKILKSEASTKIQNVKNIHNKSKQMEKRHETNILYATKNLQNKSLPKSLSQSKNGLQLIDLCLDDLGNSISVKQNNECKKSIKIRTTTEGSQKSQQSSSYIYKKLEMLNVKESWMSIENKGRFVPVPSKVQSKQAKPSNFVIRQKLTKQLYNQQRDQIKFVREVIENHVGPNLTKVINVKNYTKFFPKIMHIQC